MAFSKLSRIASFAFVIVLLTVPASAFADVTLEGEFFSYSGKASVVTELANASEGDALRLYRGAVAVKTQTIPQGDIVVRARGGGDCESLDPHLTVRVDGTAVISAVVRARNLKAPAAFFTARGIRSGLHTFTVTNDTPPSDCDPGLRFDVLILTEPTWVGDFETGGLSQWDYNQSCPDAVQTVDEPVRAGNYAASVTVTDTSIHLYCPEVATDNPTAHLNSPWLFYEGSDFYVGFSAFFPADFPVPPDWFQLAEIYGPPYGGSPTMEIDVVGNRLTFARDATHNYDMPWTSSTDIAKGTRWEDIVLHVKLSTDPAVGFVELWHNGFRQTFQDGSQTLRYRTIVPLINGGPNRLQLGQYRSSAPLGAVTIFYDQVKIGDSYESVLP